MLIFHIIALILTSLAVLYTDEKALQWVRGKKETLPVTFIHRAHILVSIGLASIIATGGLMFLSRVDSLLHTQVFLVKMVFVGTLVINGFFINRLAVTATERPFASLSSREKFPLFISGAVSVIAWVGAIICGLLLSS